MVTVVLVSGAAVGLGVWLIVLGLRPYRPPLAEALATIDPPAALPPVIDPASIPHDGWERVGGPVVRVLLRLAPTARSWMPTSVVDDLRVLGRTVDRHLAEKVLAALVGFALPGLVSATLVASGLTVPVTPPLLASVVLAVAGFVVPDGSVRSEAHKRRQEFRAALMLFVDLTSVSLAAGAGVEQALEEAARTGRGWAFAQLSRALDATRFGTESPWQALGRLGDELGVPELCEIASSVGLAGREGAPVRRSLTARAQAMRAQRLAEVDAASKRATDLMNFPVVLIAIAFIVFLAYPSLSRVLGS